MVGNDQKYMVAHTKLSDIALRCKIRNKEICFGGNRKLSIYGLLNCTSGKRMKKENRVFFGTEQEAQQNNFRPCYRCLKETYKKWKNGLV